MFQKLNAVSHILTLLYLKINDMRGDDLPPAQIASLAKLQGEEGKENRLRINRGPTLDLKHHPHPFYPTESPDISRTKFKMGPR